MRTRTMRWWVTLMLGGLALAGCSDAGEPGPDATGSQTPEPTAGETADPTPSATEPTAAPPEWPEPTRPEAMERDDIEGAKAAAEYFLALYPYVFATGDLEVWEEMSHPECQFCETVRSRVTELHSQGGYGTGGEIEINEIDAVPPDQEFPHFRVSIRGTEASSASHSSSGESLESAPGGEIYYTIGALPGGDWTIRGVVIEEAE